MLVETIQQRAAVYAALGDPHRLALVEELTMADRSPKELAALLDIDGNLLAHHLGVLEAVGLIARVDSQGDRRRKYVHLDTAKLAQVGTRRPLTAGRLVFICTENVARSVLAAATWSQIHEVPATSGGIAPAKEVHPATLAAAARSGLDVAGVIPRPIPELTETDLVVTVCDRAHEALVGSLVTAHLHWSVADPVRDGRRAAFDRAAKTIAERVGALAERVRAA